MQVLRSGIGIFHIIWQSKSILPMEGVHLTLPPHITSVQVKSRSMLHHGSVGASLKQNKRNLKKPKPKPNPKP